MDNSDLYQIAEQDHIGVFAFSLPETQSMSTMLPDGYMAIGIDDRAMTSTAEERVHLAHELGHCMTGSFYNPYSPLDIREKHEYRADRWAIQRLMPQDQVIDAVKHGITEVWELAELFGVTEQLVRKAVDYYKEQQLLQR